MPFRGRHTAETKARIAAALKGRPRPPEVRAKIAQGKRGKKLTPAHRLSIRVGHRVIQLFKPDQVAERSARSRATMRANWNSPAFRERWRAGRERYRRALRGEPPPSAAAERRRRVAEMRSAGMTQAAIGKALGISRQRVCQLLRSAPPRRDATSRIGPPTNGGPAQQGDFLGVGATS